MTQLSDLCEALPPDKELAPLDRSDIDESTLTLEQIHWRRHGYVVLRNFIPQRLIDAYCEDWLRDNDVETGMSKAWGQAAYLHSPAALDLLLWDPLVEILGPLVGGEVGLHLTLTNWRSTERNFHQDDYLNPPFVNSWYAAAWIALDHVYSDAGPFQLIKGSHKWPRLRRELVLEKLGLDSNDPDWPRKSEQELTPLVEREMRRLDVMETTCLLRRGDVLIWHGCTYHRGSRPTNPNRERRALIAHFSAKHKRTDMNPWVQHGNGYYFDIGGRA